MSLLQGLNRWYYKWSELWWNVQLKLAVEELFNRYDLSERFDGKFYDVDQDPLLRYIQIEVIHTGSKLLEGEKYPAASAVIPLVDQILTDLVQQERENKGDMKRFSYLKKNMKKWF